MSSIVSSITGTAGGAGGTGFAGPSGANILNPSTTQQADQLYGQNQDALTQQQNFLTALQGQNGIGNQNQVFNQLSGVANGTGPNPAAAALNQATATNTANQAALMAGQRGSGANAGLIARQAAQQGGANQQNAASQAATMQANQSLNAINSMGNIAGQQVTNQAAATGANTGAVQGEQGQILGSIQGQNNSNVGMQNNINNANAGLAGQRLGAQGQLLGGVLQGAASGMFTGTGAGAGAGANGGKVENLPKVAMANGGPTPAAQAPTTPQVGAQSSFARFIKGATAAQPDSGQPQTADQSLNKAGQAWGNALGSGAKSMFSSKPASPTTSDMNGTSSGQTGLDSTTSPTTPTTGTQGAPIVPSMLDADGFADGGMVGLATKLAPMLAMAMAQGGKVPALLSPGEKYLPPQAVAAAKKGADPMAVGKTVPGKPKVAGAKNSYANDTVKATLEEGGLVLPRSVTQSKNPQWAAHKFVMAHMAKGGLVPKLTRKAK